jgi:glycosyltransferase EpsE
MKANPLVSVIMGVYNCERTVRASVESMLAQDYRELELVIVDDGSSDGTAEIVRGCAQKDGRIILLQNERNRGLARSLNRCIEAAAGQYLARMDGDDLSCPDRIGKQVRFLEEHGEYGFCGSTISLFDSSGTWGRVAYPELPDAGSFLFRNPFAHPTVVFRAALLKDAGGYDCDPSIGRSEDYDLFMRLYASGSRGYNIQEDLLRYREDLDSLKKRKFRYAVTEARVRLRGFRRLGLLPKGLAYAAKPILVGLIPKAIYKRMRKAAFGGSRDAIARPR